VLASFAIKRRTNKENRKQNKIERKKTIYRKLKTKLVFVKRAEYNEKLVYENELTEKFRIMKRPKIRIRFIKY